MPEPSISVRFWGVRGSIPCPGPDRLRYGGETCCVEIRCGDDVLIFEPYYTTKKEGSGLGLMIVQRIIQDHGGRIDVHSEPGMGTTFTVFLPLDTRRVRLLKAPARPGPDAEETP